MPILPEIFSESINDPGVHADVLLARSPGDLPTPPRKADPAAFVADWRSRARTAARTGGGRVLALQGEKRWRLAGGLAVPLDAEGDEVDPASLAGAVLFVEGEDPTPVGAPAPGVSLDLPADAALFHALFGAEAPSPDELAELACESDAPSGGLSWIKLRALARIGGAPADGLDELCARFAWGDGGGETVAPAGEAILELGRLLKDRSDQAIFSLPAGPRWLGGLSGPPLPSHEPDARSLSLPDYARVKALLARGAVEADADRFMADAAARGSPLRQVVDGVCRLRLLADQIMPSDYVGEHERAVAEALPSGEVSPEAVASHPHLFLAMDGHSAQIESAGTSLRPFVTVRLAEDFVPEAVVPTGSGTHVYRRPDLLELGGADEIRELALCDWGKAMLASGVPRELAEARLAPFCVPGGRPVIAAADGRSRWAVRPSLDEEGGRIVHVPSHSGGQDGDFVAILAAAPTYDEAIVALARSGAVLPTAASDPVLRRILSGDDGRDGAPIAPLQAAFSAVVVDGAEVPAVTFGEAAVYRDGADYAIASGGRKLGALPDRASAFAAAMALASLPPSLDDSEKFSLALAHAGIDPDFSVG